MSNVMINWTRRTDYTWEGDWESIPELYREGLIEPSEDDETGWEKALEAIHERLDRSTTYTATRAQTEAWVTLERDSEAQDDDVTIDSVE